MARESKVLTLKMGDPRIPGSAANVATTLERHLDVQELPKLLAEGWVMVSASPPDEEGNSRIVLEREIPGGKPGT